MQQKMLPEYNRGCINSVWDTNRHLLAADFPENIDKCKNNESLNCIKEFENIFLTANAHWTKFKEFFRMEKAFNSSLHGYIFF
jgi:hypothetical protein